MTKEVTREQGEKAREERSTDYKKALIAGGIIAAGVSGVYLGDKIINNNYDRVSFKFDAKIFSTEIEAENYK